MACRRASCFCLATSFARSGSRRWRSFSPAVVGLICADSTPSSQGKPFRTRLVICKMLNLFIKSSHESEVVLAPSTKPTARSPPSPGNSLVRASSPTHWGMSTDAPTLQSMMGRSPEQYVFGVEHVLKKAKMADALATQSLAGKLPFGTRGTDQARRHKH